MFFNISFSRCFVVLASEIVPKIDDFSILFRKRRFYEKCDFPEEKRRFLRFRAFKNPPQIDVKSHSKQYRKKIA